MPVCLHLWLFYGRADLHESDDIQRIIDYKPHWSNGTADDKGEYTGSTVDGIALK